MGASCHDASALEETHETTPNDGKIITRCAIHDRASKFARLLMLVEKKCARRQAHSNEGGHICPGGDVRTLQDALPLASGLELRIEGAVERSVSWRDTIL